MNYELRITNLMNISLLIIFMLFLAGNVSAATEETSNEMGLIPVLEYHRIGPGERAFTRSIENFKKDLIWLKNNGYATITMEDFIEQKISIPRGKKPVIFTFDDSTSSQFKYLSDDKIDPDSAIGIMDKFFYENPEFGRHAIFYVNSTFFEQPEYKKKKLDYLLATGREIGNHTVNHASMRDLTASEVSAELGGIQSYVENLALRKVEIISLAYPFGSVPKNPDSLKAVESGSFNSVKYQIKTALLVGADPSHPPYSTKFDALRVPRIQADDTEWKRWFGRESGETARNLDSELFTPYVSDGDSNLLTILEKKFDLVSQENLRKDLKICFSDKEDCASLVSTNETNNEEIKEKTVSENIVSVDLKPKTGSGAIISLEPVKSEGIFKRIHDRLERKIGNVIYSVQSQIPNIKVNELPSELVYKNSSFHYIVKEGENINVIVNKFLAYTRYYLPSQLKEAIEEENNISDGSIRVDESLIIPNVEFFIYDVKPNLKDRKGIYWTAYTASSKEALNQIEKLKKAGGNMIVFDLKETDGVIFYDSKLPFASENKLINVRIPDVSKLVRFLHQNGIYAVARITVFKDISLAKAKPSFAPKNRSNGQPWSNKEGVVWLDPSLPAVQDYVFSLSEEIAKLGVDEIQYDYVRFPEQTSNDPDFYYDETKFTRQDIITDFLEKASSRIRPLGTKLSVDVFGVVVWSNGFDAKIVGQDIGRISNYVDVIYPMVYPSHFGAGFGGHANPGGEPYYFVQESMKKFKEQASGSQVEVIPWIQGFSWGATGYGTNYIHQQIKGASDIGINSFVIWNAGNNYDVSWGAF